MAVLVYNRLDIAKLADRLAQRADSVMLVDMPRLGSDMKAASRLLTKMLEQGMPPTSFEIQADNDNRT